MQLYEQMGVRLFRAASRLLGHRADAEDAVQEVFLSLVRSRQRLRDVADLRAYLFTSLRHTAGRIAATRDPRIGGEELVSLDGLPSRGETEPSHPHGERLERALRALPMEQREVIAMKIDFGLTFAEIAAVLGLSANTAAARYRYALERLRESLGARR